MKSYTDIEQSRKLSEILPLESADMQWFLEEDYGIVQIKEELQDWGGDCTIPCWSLAALLSVLPKQVLLNGSMEESYWYCKSEDAFNTYSFADSNNPIDACYNLILKLHELKML